MANQPPPDTMDPNDERKLQLFLERAAPIVLESRVLDTENWRRLVTFAQELEMTDGQLRATVEDLRRRGVIERIELQPTKPAKPTPKPPPLPARPTTASPPPTPPSAPRGSVGQAAEANSPPVREKTFSLNSPVPPLPTQPPPPPASSTANNTPPPPTAVKRTPPDPASKGALREQLSRRATEIIAEQRGFTPKTHSLIASEAKTLGLSDQDVTEVVRALHQGDNHPQESSADDANQRQRWKEEGKPEPPRHEAPKKPHEIFSAFAAQSLDKLAVGHVSSDLEDGLVAHGTKVLKLSQVYATQLVRDVANQKNLLLETDTNSPGATEETTAIVDPRLQTFLDRAAPILAQNRGLNARSRVLLGAMAEEVGLAQSEVDAAVALLESKPAETDGLDAEQRKRLAPFRRYAAEMLGQLPQRILTARIHTMMLERGEERFGIDAERARAVLRELGAEQQIQIITEEEALRHIEGLVDEQLGDALRLEPSVKARILHEGSQWGLPAEDIEKIIKQNCRRNYRKRRSERNLTNAALVAAFVAVLLVVGFLGWAMLGGRMTPKDPPPEPPVVTFNPVTTAQEVDDGWWSVDLVLAVHNATTEFPLLRRTLKAISSPDPTHRATAYEDVTRHALVKTDDAVQRNMLLSVISQAYAVEPDEATAGKISQGLVNAIPGPEDRLSQRAEEYPRIFWAMRGAVAALRAADDNPRRADDIARSIGNVVGTTVDRELPMQRLERQCLGALAERLFRLMISSAASRPSDAPSLHRVIAEEAGRYLDPTRIETLNAEFLAAFLSAREAAWSEVQPLIDEAVKNRDPLIVAKLIDVYEMTDNSELRSHLQTGLLRRADLTPIAKEARAIASEIRQKLKITEVITTQGRTLDFLRVAKRALSAKSAKTDERIKAADQAARLSHVATLGCALAQGESGLSTFDELIKVEPAELTAAVPDEDSMFPTNVGTDWDALEKIDSAIGRLPRGGSSNQVGRIESIASVADKVRDLRPAQASLLAAYLLSRKQEAEHTKVMEHVPKFRRWSHLHLAVADGMYRPTLQPDQLQTLLSTLLEEKITLGGGEAGREAVRGALLRRAIANFEVTGPAVSNVNLVDRARSRLFDNYVRQANLLGVPQSSLAEATGPAVVLKAIIGHYAARLTGASPSKDATLQIAEIPHQIEAIEYIATNRLQQTVLLERTWLQLLALDLKKIAPTSAEESARILHNLQQTDRTAGHSLAQLEANQTAFVQMWMLRNRPQEK